MIGYIGLWTVRCDTCEFHLEHIPQQEVLSHVYVHDRGNPGHRTDAREELWDVPDDIVAEHVPPAERERFEKGLMWCRRNDS